MKLYCHVCTVNKCRNHDAQCLSVWVCCAQFMRSRQSTFLFLFVSLTGSDRGNSPEQQSRAKRVQVHVCVRKLPHLSRSPLRVRALSLAQSLALSRLIFLTALDSAINVQVHSHFGHATNLHAFWAFTLSAVFSICCALLP